MIMNDKKFNLNKISPDFLNDILKYEGKKFENFQMTTESDAF